PPTSSRRASVPPRRATATSRGARARAGAPTWSAHSSRRPPPCEARCPAPPTWTSCRRPEEITMEKFTTHTGTGVPLRRSNVDTDQIIPAVYLKRVSRTGFADGLFSAWRGDETFVLNQPPYREGLVLVAPPDFGSGSSREHSVWAPNDYSLRVIISYRFAEIFRGISAKQGPLA